MKAGEVRNAGHNDESVALRLVKPAERTCMTIHWGGEGGRGGGMGTS